MIDIINQLSAFGVFIAIAAIGFLFLLVSLIFGEIFEHFDHSLDHDMDHGDGGGPVFFSARGMAVFITAFGGFGAVGIYYGLSILGASGLGFVSGLVCATVIFFFARFLYGQQASTQLRVTDLVGRTAMVTVRIGADAVGQVRCQVGEDMVERIAKSIDGQAISENTMVRIETLAGEMVVVKKI
jgi:hypothetical protein